MRRGLRSAQLQITNHKSQITQRGYMLITLMLAVALAAMALLAVLPEMGQQIRRDREEEMIHRGTAYMRAIQHYYKKFGRYPTRIEDLENTNNLRFLRKRYKDPTNRDAQGKELDFKLLHMQDVSVNNGPLLGQIPGVGGSPGLGGQPGLGQPGLGQPGLGQPGLGQPGPGGMQPILTQVQQPGSPAGAPNAGDDASGNPANPQGNSGSSSSSSSSSSAGTTGAGAAGGQVFGGGPILGVSSTNKKDKTIREFNKKDHYNEWFFIYDPTSDVGGLLVGPWQTPQTKTLQGATPAGQLPGGPQPSGLGPSGSPPQNPPAQTPQNPGPGSAQQ